jgi:hypothetical protein
VIGLDVMPLGIQEEEGVVMFVKADILAEQTRQ